MEFWLRAHFCYRGETREVLRTVPRMLSDLQNQNCVEGDCDDVSVFASALLTRMGIKNRFVAIRYGGSQDYLHVFVEWWSNPAQRWVRIDPTVRPGLIHQEDMRMVLEVL